MAVTVVVFVGESQQSSDMTGSLITAAESVGNFRNLQLKNQAGQWSLKMMSSNPYTVRVIGERSMMLFHHRNPPLGLVFHFSASECLNRMARFLMPEVVMSVFAIILFRDQLTTPTEQARSMTLNQPFMPFH